MKHLIEDVRDAYSGQPWLAGVHGLFLVAGVAAAALVGNWWALVLTVFATALMVSQHATAHGYSIVATEANNARIQSGRLLEWLRGAEEAHAATRFELIQARADLDSAPSTGADIRHMCAAFGQDVHDTLNRPDDAVRGLRVALLSEEFREYMEAERSANIVEIADALADMTVVIYGTAAAYGIDLDACCAEVYRSNMTKLTDDGEVVRNEQGKVLKPDTYQPPNLADVIGHMDGGPWSEQAAA